jgi:hypothetical protein
MSMTSLTRTVGFLLILLGVVGYVATGGASITALIPALVGAVFLVIALVARNAEARKHAMHAAVALALLGVLGTAPRIMTAVRAGDITRPAVMAQIAMALILLIYVLFGVKSFIDARKARG